MTRARRPNISSQESQRVAFRLEVVDSTSGALCFLGNLPIDQSCPEQCKQLVYLFQTQRARARLVNLSDASRGYSVRIKRDVELKIDRKTRNEPSSTRANLHTSANHIMSSYYNT